MRPAGWMVLALLAPAGGCAEAPSQAPSPPPSPPVDPDPDSSEPPLTGQEGDDDPGTVTGAPAPTGSAGAALLAEVDRQLSRKVTSTYVHRTHVDEASGTFDYDCSGLLR